MGRWDAIDRIRKQSAIEAIVAQMAKVLFDELSNWPPQITWSDQTTMKEKYEALFAPHAARPCAAAYAEAVKQARWDFSREFEALEHYRRNHHLEQVVDGAYDRTSERLHSVLPHGILIRVDGTHRRPRSPRRRARLPG